MHTFLLVVLIAYCLDTLASILVLYIWKAYGAYEYYHVPLSWIWWLNDKELRTTINLRIYKEHTDGANFYSYKNCPIGHAMREMGFHDVVVDLSDIYADGRVYKYDGVGWNKEVIKLLQEGDLNYYPITLKEIHS